MSAVTAQEQLSEVLAGLKQKAAALEGDNERLRKNVIALFRRMRADGGKCRYCDAPVFWLRHSDSPGKVGIYDPDGTSHWSTCPKRVQARAEMGKR